MERPTTNKNARPSAPGNRGGVPADPPNPANRPTVDLEEPVRTVLRGAPARTAKNMDSSLTVPTATSVRSLPVKLLIDQRVVINNHLRRARGGKVSYTHLIGFAMVQALKTHPAMNNGYEVVDGKPTMVVPRHINLGLAIDMPKPDGTRQLLVPSIKSCENLDFAQFWAAYEEIVKKARSNSLTVEDFQGTTITLTNPGTIGTNHSVPRLMNGQGAIIGVGSMDYPPEFQGSDPDKLSLMSVSKVMTLTSTYDHRVIQGAGSGQYLARLHALLLGEDGFYDDVFSALRIPYEPIRWAQDVSADHEDQVSKQARIFEMINAYRVRGHLMADTDPLEYRQRSHHDLDVQTHSLTLWDLDREFATGAFAGGQGLMKMRKILGILRDSYCRTIGIEYMHIQEPAQRKWIQDRVERPHESLPREEHLRILDKLNEAEIFETFLQTKFVGQKRFSLEGGEATIALLDEVCEQAANHGLEEVCIGMPHRGRLNVLANIVGKSYAQIFREFEGNIDPRTVQGSGDVKYHLGAEGKFTALSGATIKTSVAANPSHLEAVNPVLEGIARAKQDILDRGSEFPVMPVLMHGDAAFAGQGVVAETLNLSQLRGYRTGGTIHIIVNNQVGFTTSPTESRSSMYCTDVARMIQAPIFHVNGDDPEACIRVARLAFAFRQEFNKDVVVDIICYRRRGHNEGDDPSFTQPLMYDLIEKKRSTRKLYTEALIGRGDITIEDAEAVMTRYQQRLESVFREVRDASQTDHKNPLQMVPAYPSKEAAPHGTAVSMETLKKIADAHLSFPDGFSVHPKVMPQLQRRSAAITQGGIDWGTAEILALGLAADGGPDGPADRSGQPARHLRPALRLRGGPQDRRVVRAAEAPRRRPGQVPHLRLPAQRVRGDGLRVRLLRGPARRPGAVGGAVRRLRQRCADDHRRVHLVRTGEVDPEVRGHAAAAARLRGAGARPQLGPDRAVPAAGGRGLDRRRPAVDPGQPLPPAAAARHRRAAPPAGDHDAEVDAAEQAGRLAAGGLHRGPVASRAGRPAHHRRRRRPPGHPVLGQGPLGPHHEAGPAGPLGHRDHPGRAALPAGRRGDRRGAAQVRQRRRRAALGAGRAGQPGGVAVHGAEPDRARSAAAEPSQQWTITPHHPARLVGAVGGVGQGARGSAARAARVGLPLTRSRGAMYFTDRGIEELEARRGDDEVTLAWLAEQLRSFVDLHPEFEGPVEQLATWLARLDDEED